MLAISAGKPVQPVERPSSFLHRPERWLIEDHFPHLRPYLRWTRQPLTWLLLAAIATLLCGRILQPEVLWLSAWIACVILLGICWPWLALRGVACRMSFSDSRTTEDEAVGVTLTLVNRWPWPLWGLAIVGGLRQIAGAAPHAELPIAAALAAVPAWSESTFQWEFAPSCRGHYPSNSPLITTGFPFGLWQARNVVTVENRLVVWPRRYAIPAAMPGAGVDQAGLGLADARPGDAGDVLGLRPYRRGDLLKRVHWPQTARQGRLIVCERQAATRPAVRVVADLRGRAVQGFSDQMLEATIRAAASLCGALQRQHARVEYCDAETTFRVAPGSHGLEPVLDRLAMVPVEGLCHTPAQAIGRRSSVRHGMLEIVVTADRSIAPRQQSRASTSRRFCIVVGDAIEPVGQQWETICREA